MLDQSFSVKTFQEIFDLVNRKGINVEKRYNEEFENSLKKVQDLKKINKEIRNEKDYDKRKLLFQKKKEIKIKRDKLILSSLETIVEKLDTHRVNLIKGGNHGGQCYVLEDNAVNFFISKKLQENIRETYYVQQFSRHSLLSQVINLIEDDFPKVVIRTDIKNFYESIPQKRLLDKIDSDYLLSIMSKRYINEIFNQYNKWTNQTNSNNPKGVPRGVGISAYLSELYMRSIDNKIKDLDDILFYGRYVDDIIVAFSPQRKTENKTLKYRSLITEIINNSDLRLNNSKTKEYNLLNGIRPLTIERKHYLDSILIKDEIYNDEKGNPKSIHFLGYRIGSILIMKEFSNPKPGQKAKKQYSTICIELSENKHEKYRKKIKKSFNDFKKKSKHNRKYAFRLLVARISYLTSNTKLRNNKDKVFVGIYYSNPFLNNFTTLDKLQKYLKWHIDHNGLSVTEKEILYKYSFITGFKQKTFCILPIKKKQYNRSNYRNGDVINEKNKGVLQFGLKEINSVWK